MMRTYKDNDVRRNLPERIEFDGYIKVDEVGLSDRGEKWTASMAAACSSYISESTAVALTAVIPTTCTEPCRARPTSHVGWWGVSLVVFSGAIIQYTGIQQP